MNLLYFFGLCAGIACFNLPDAHSSSSKINEAAMWWSIPQWKYGAIQTPPKPKITWDIRHCPAVCQAIYKPICAFDKFLNRYNFPNTCELKRYNCIYKQDFQILHDGQCMKAAIVKCNQTELDACECPTKSNPFDCKSNSSPIDHCSPFEVNSETSCQQFPKCSRFHSFMYGQICQINFSAALRNKCNQVCSHIYKPVCVIDEYLKRYTFVNECVLKVYNSFYEKNLQIICEGACF